MIFKKLSRSHFTTVCNKLLENDKISLLSKGLMCWLLSKPENWQINITHLMNTHAMGKDKVYAIVKELVSEGYLERHEIREKGKFLRYDYHIHESPLAEKPEAVQPLTVLPLPANPHDNKDLSLVNTDISTHTKGNAKKSKQTQEDRKLHFNTLLVNYKNTNSGKYPIQLYNQFFRYWTEVNEISGGGKMRFEDCKFFEVGKRLATFWRNVRNEERAAMWKAEQGPTVINLFAETERKLNINKQ